MNKLMIGAALGILLVLGGLLVYLNTRCDEPTEMQVAVVQLNCAVQFLNQPVEDIRNEACNYLGKEFGCEFEEGDREKIIEMIDKKVYDCSKAALEAKNLCTDKLEKG